MWGWGGPWTLSCLGFQSRFCWRPLAAPEPASPPEISPSYTISSCHPSLTFSMLCTWLEPTGKRGLLETEGLWVLARREPGWRRSGGRGIRRASAQRRWASVCRGGGRQGRARADRKGGGSQPPLPHQTLNYTGSRCSRANCFQSSQPVTLPTWPQQQQQAFLSPTWDPAR